MAGASRSRRCVEWRVLSAVVVSILLVLPTSAAAGGRLLETGHDADWRCAVAGTECHFLQVAIRYVRNGAPDPSRPVLVLDNGDLEMRTALLNAFGSGFASQMRVVDPRSAAFATSPLSTAFYSAIVVASDQTCGFDVSVTFGRGDSILPENYCDLNRPVAVRCTAPGVPAGCWPPPVQGQPGTLLDSTAIIARDDAIKAFFDSGGGLYVGSGADNGDGHADDKYYAFLDLPGGAAGSACDPSGMGPICAGAAGGLALTAEGRAIGFTDGTNGTSDDIHCGLAGGGCATHNSFNRPLVGSQLMVAETGPSTFETTLFEDLKPPNTLVTSGPGRPIFVARPRPPMPVLSSHSAHFTFRASEDTTSFACQFDTATVTSCNSSQSAAGLSEGVHRFAVVATDAAHNEDPTPAVVSWLVSSDRDHDGYLHANPFGSVDCNDHNSRIHPRAREIRGNRIDENCNHKIAPFLRLRAAFPFGFVPGGCGGCIRFVRLAAASLPRHASVTLRCRGSACHFVRHAGRARRDGGRISLLRYVRNRSIPSGTVLEIRVTRGRAIGAVKRLAVAKGDVKDSLRCLPPGRKRAQRHCASIR